MRNVFKRLFVTTGVALLLSLSFMAPAQANAMPEHIKDGLVAAAAKAGVSEKKALKAIEDCQAFNGHICFWNWYNFQNGGNWYHTHIQNAYGPSCIVLPATMADKTTSFYFNTTFQTSTSRIRYFLWSNCNAGGGYFTLAATQSANYQPDLTCPSFMNPCSSFYNDNIVSVDYIFA
jgi:hypothetical protein